MRAALVSRGDLRELEPDTEAVVIGAYRYLARSPARIVMLQIEDALGEHSPVNIPGTNLRVSELAAQTCATISTRSRPTEGSNDLHVRCGSYARAHEVGGGKSEGGGSMKGVLMAGGEGSRLRPLTSRRPKPLAPVAGKPVMEHIIALLRRHGITEIVATLHYLADEVESYFDNGADFGVTMEYVVEDTPLGTAGAVKMADKLLAGETFLVISGDALTDIDLTALIEHHKREQNDVTIALQRVTNPLEFGVVVTDENGRITRFLEKPSWGEVFSDTINTGIYVLEPGILERMIRGRNYDFSKDLFPDMLRDGAKLGGYIIDAYWTDIGNLEQYQQANYDALEGKVHLDSLGTEIAPGVLAGEDCRIDPSARAAPADRARRRRAHRGRTSRSSARRRSATARSSSAARASNARVLWEDCYVGEDAAISDCTVADRNTIERNATISESTVIGRGCTIGSGAIVNANLKLWPDKWVTSGSIVSMSLIYGQKWPGSLFGSVGISGLANLEFTPEFALKLGQAFGSYLKPGQSVMTSRDTHPATRVMNRCVISGLLSVGIHVLDLRSYPLPLARYAVRIGGDGGVHMRVAPNDPNALIMEFFDSQGITTDKGTERKIENLFFREDFRRTRMDDVGQPRLPLAHARTLHRRVPRSAHRARGQGSRLQGRDRLRVGQRIDRAAAAARRPRRRSDLAQRVLRRAARAQFPRRPRTPPRTARDRRARRSKPISAC